MGVMDRRLGMGLIAGLVLMLLIVLPSTVALAHEDSTMSAARPGVPDPELDEALGAWEEALEAVLA